MRKIVLTEHGERIVEAYLVKLRAKRKEILDAHKDTADMNLPTKEVILDDIEYFLEEMGGYINSWGATDTFNANTRLSLHQGVDFVIKEN